MAIIAIVSGSYCCGDDVIEGVSQRLDCRRIDDILPDEISARYGIGKERVLGTLTCTESVFQNISRKRKRILAYIEVTLAELLLSDNVILGGCVSYMIPGNIPHVLRVCIIANHDFRVNRAVKLDNISESEAVEKIQEHDRNISACANHYTQLPAYDERSFDVVIPMQNTSVVEAVEIICRQANLDAVKTTERSQGIAGDFYLAAKVKLELVLAGHDVNVFAETGQVNIEINERTLWKSKLENKLKAIAAAVPGVEKAVVELGPKAAAPSLNPWDRVEIPPRILLVDDEKEFVHTLSERLKTRNFESSIAYDGEQAIEMVRKETPDVIILDLIMPGIDGIETLRQVKKLNPEIEVIILTGHGSDKEKEMAEELGAFAYLRKPVNINDLAQKMKEAYARRSRKR